MTLMIISSIVTATVVFLYLLTDVPEMHQKPHSDSSCRYGYVKDAESNCRCTIENKIVDSLVHEDRICIPKDACTEHAHCNALGPHLTCEEADEITRVGKCLNFPAV